MAHPSVSAGAVSRACRPRIQCLTSGSVLASSALISENLSVRSTLPHFPVPKHHQQCRRFHESRARLFQKSARRQNEDNESSSARPSTTSKKQTPGSGIPSVEEIAKNTPKYAKGAAERIMRETQFDFDGDMQQLPKDDPVEFEDFGPPESGFFSMGEENTNNYDDEDFQGDDISSTAHAELEYVREIRELFRASAWDMPLLWSHAKPFDPPTKAQPLRFRYTTYFGEYHPAARKVVVTFTPSQLDENLTHVQISKMIKLLGPRYDPSKDTAKLSCEMFPTVPQNKRWLGDMVDKILAEVKDTSKDTFEDLPFDFRHHTTRKKHTFPEEWKLTEEKRASLVAERSRRMLLEEESKVANKLVDGAVVVDQAIEFADPRAQPVTVPAGRARR